MANKGYVLANGVGELERLRLQARVWESDAEAMLDRIGVGKGWKCVDLGCGAMGILGPLSRRVGPSGRVIGVDSDARQLEAARAYVEEEGLDNVELVERDAYRTGLTRGAFDLVHVRFVLAPAGRDAELLREMLALAKRGGVLAIEEPDSTAWACFPPRPGWTVLKDAVLAAFKAGGGDFDAGQRTYRLLRSLDFADVHVRAAVVALPPRHPYLKLPAQFAASLRSRIVDGGILSAPMLDAAIAQCEEAAQDPETFGLSFVLTQVWGRKR
jgi:SAM-dependent methyltransferase